jgi:hypothetical protein
MRSSIEEIGFLLSCSENRRPELRYAMDFIAAALGVRLRELRPGENFAGLSRLVVIGYPDAIELPASLRIALVLPCHMDEPRSTDLMTWVEPGPLPVFGPCQEYPPVEGLPWAYRKGGNPLGWEKRGACNLMQLGFDPLGPLFHWLSRQDEIRHAKRERYISAVAAGSWVERHGLLDYPWIDRIVQFFETLLDLKPAQDERLAGLPRWPGNKKWAVALSHDVDMLFKWRFRTGIHLLMRTPIYLLSFRLRKMVGLWGELLCKMRTGRDPWFLLDEMMDLESRHGVLSTFFFLAEPKDHQTYRYHIARPQVVSLLAQIQERGFELALHAGYFSFRNRDRLKREKLRFENAASVQALGVRQHWLRFEREFSWLDHELSGFQVDSSLGFNDRPGFRAGTSLPFHPWDLQTRQGRELLEVPLSLMDSQLFDEQTLDFDAAKQQLETLFSNLRQSHGLLVVNWHSHVLCEADFPERRKLYEWLLEETLKDAHVGGVMDLATHWRRRDLYRRGLLGESQEQDSSSQRGPDEGAS